MDDALKEFDKTIGCLRRELETTIGAISTAARPTPFALTRIILERAGWLDLVALAAVTDPQFAEETFAKAVKIMKDARDSPHIPSTRPT